MKDAHLIFVPTFTKKSRKTFIWEVGSKKGSQVLGTIQWYAPWRRYCFFPTTGTLFDAECLREIATFCETATAEQKRQRAKEK